MEKLTIDEIVNAVKGSLIVKGTAFNFTNVSTDTRKLAEGSIFIGLKGDKFNGNKFTVEAAKKGCFLCIVDEKLFEEKELPSQTSVILVKNTYDALIELAKYYRSKLNIKVIAITGSTGKTSTKDLVSAALSEKYNVFKTDKNYNNHIGLPLMLLNLDNSYDVAVLEMGMSNFNEIHKLADAARPNIGIITNIGISHLENLKTQENILKAKMEITDFFNKDSVLIVNNDDKYLSRIKSDSYKIVKTGINNKSDYTAENVVLGQNDISFDIFNNNDEDTENFRVELLGRHNVYNSLISIACAKVMNVDYEDIKRGLKNIKKTGMRLQILEGQKFTIVNDCYNASPDSMKAAIDVVSKIKANRKIAIFGTMKELGDKSFDAHVYVAKYAKDNKFDYMFTTGEFNEAFGRGFGNENFKAFDSKVKLIEYLKTFIKEKDIVLVKASRYMKFENIINELQKINCSRGDKL